MLKFEWEHTTADIYRHRSAQQWCQQHHSSWEAVGQRGVKQELQRCQQGRHT